SLSTFYAGGTITMTKDDSQTFSISSIDVAQWGAFSVGYSGNYAAFFTGYDALNNVIASQICTGPDIAGGQPVLSTCNLTGFNNIASLVFTEGTYESGEAAQFTNIVVNDTTPEPGTPLLIGSGLLGMMVLARKRWMGSLIRA
ncbi:MAG TPA: PEP-CTERM sorting domain-containing protein, partial [Bryobacteraceae bacterium]|nr:PEP-CTERM sorting domain-containing protein [Bryobacteraceae bacterium]